jgi:hypothetical protein
MRRRPVLRALLGSTALSALAGCNALFAREPDTTPRATSGPAAADGRTATTSVAGSQSSPASSTDASTPYRAAGEPTLDRPRGVHVRNLASTDRFVTVIVAVPDTATEILAESVTVPAGETRSFPDLLVTTGRYGVLVEAADGTRGRYDWTVVDTLDDLWVDLVPDLSFHRPVLCSTDCPFVVRTGEMNYDVPATVGVGEALGRRPALAVDNDTPGETELRLKIWQQGTLHLDARYALPPDVRLLVPVFPPGRRYDILLRSADGESIYDWQPSVTQTLYAALAGGPAFRCGYARHDLRVRNESDVGRRLRLRVLTGDETLFERSFELDPNEKREVPAAVSPAGPLRFELATDDGRRETYNWVRCAPAGPIVVTVSDDGVSVAVRPTLASE